MIRVKAHAKVNLYLHVVGKRADGYHLLDSLVVFADLHDDVVAEAAHDLTLAIDGPFGEALSGESDNLVLRAARGLADAYRIEPKAKLTLTKRIPVSAGIGGGSADAAATLAALAQLWSVEVPIALLQKLGADVPACFAGQPLFMSGIGENLAPAPQLPPTWILLVNPGVAVSTRDVFRARNGAFSQAAPFNVAPIDAARLARFLLHRRNDLTAAATIHAREIREARERIGATEGCLLARMSGSGATVFGLYGSEEEAARAAASISSDRPSWWCWSGAIRV